MTARWRPAIADTDSVSVDSLRRLLVAPADTDSVAFDSARVDSLALDSLVADSLAVPPDTGRASRYIRRALDAAWARGFPRRTPGMGARMGRYWQQRTTFDTTNVTFHVRETVADGDVRIPLRLDLERFRTLRLEYDLDRNWRQLVVQRARMADQRNRGGLGFNIVVPGGRQSAFTTIFGKPSVDLRVNGQADIKAGFDYRKSDQQVAITGRASQLDPDFKQDLSLGITGSIGDKLQINVQYDSKNQFDYQNQLKLQYTGYEDEIIQKIEAGNVFLQTPSTLIRGGQSLFGIKSEFQVGGVKLTTVMSQQEGQANSLNIEGGSESTEFDLKPTDYDEALHFFLGYYFRNRFEDALLDPPNIRVADGFERITEIELWRLMPTTPEEQNVRQVVGVVDLGEAPALLTQADAYVTARLPGNFVDQYDDSQGGEVDSEMRDGNATPGSWLETAKKLTAADYQIGKFKKLERGRDYTIDEVLGYVSLRSRLQESEALAVAYRFTAGGRTYQVGDFSTDTGGSDGGQNENKLVLKLIRPVQLRQPAPEAAFNPAAWYLEMRNIYRLPGRGINPTDFDLQIYYEPPGRTASKTLPGVGGQQTLLQLLGLDRVNANQALRPDDQFDFLVNYTIEPGEGKLIFPYLEPFGSRLDGLITGSAPTEGAAAELSDLYVFDNLYLQKKPNARKDSQHDVFRIKGSYKGSVQDFYDLRAYAGLVQGSVRVTSGGTPLQEGADFTVDYQGGTVQITNPAFLSSGRAINIEYEQNSFFNLQKKTLLGLRADYNLRDELAVGATLMRMTQKSPIDKFRIGEEPVSNTIWGIDGSYKAEPRWLTRAVDALPLIQTKEKSRFSLTGEFAQLRPNHIETIAFERTRSELRKNGRGFQPDELGGISYIDDFEGFKNTFSLMQPGSWSLSAAPDSVRAIDRGGIVGGTVGDSLRTTWRGSFTWYRINANMLQEVQPVAFDPEAIRPLQINDVFPNRDTRAELIDQLETLDLYFDPRSRGPYNYTTRLDEFLARPRDAWGGMVQRLPEGFTDFSLKNIDFVEFVFRPFPENAQKDAGSDAKLYVDLGSISEDVLPNEKLNNEDGLSLAAVTPSALQTWGRLPNATQNSVVDIDDATNWTEDLGLDGIASYGGDYPAFATEQEHFAAFLQSLDRSNTDPRYRAEVAKALVDPSGDDYHYFANDQFFGNPEFFPGGATFQQRFLRYFSGFELNAFETQNKLANNTSLKRGNSRFPDSEDRNLNSTVDTDNSYFQYEIPLSRRRLDSLAVPTRVNDYVVGELADREGNGTGWYQVRIPVADFTRRVGNIQDFSLIESIRLWTTGNEVPVTIRFATLELVGSQWQKSDKVPLEHETAADTTASDTRFTIASINNEENADIYQPPIGAVVSQTRLASGRVQNAREQSLVMRVENLRPGRQRAIFKTQNTALDLLKYSNVRMFVHMHGKTGAGQDLASLPVAEGRSKAKLFVRLGANETNDFYEYEQPLTPSSETSGNSDALWQTATDYDGEIRDLNSVNILLAALNQLKVTRDRLAYPTDSLFYNVLGDTLVASDAPDASEFAPPGSRIGIKGTPSLGRVTSIVIGIRNAADSTSAAFEDILEDVTVWLNELRVAGYDETNGWAGLANLDIGLADLMSIKANIQTQTDGFGSLSSTLGEREQNNISNWSITSELSVDKFIPERFGWSLPVNVQIQSNTTTPRFSPTRGDVRLEELLAQIDERSDIDEPEREALRTEVIQSSQTLTNSRSLSARVSKSGSRSVILRNTLDGLSASYQNSATEARSPQQLLNDADRWSSTVSYRFSARKSRTVKPLFFLRPIPVLGALGGLQFNYVPQSITASGTLNRNTSQTRERPRPAAAGDTTATPEIVRFPLREQHAFGHTRSSAVQYNPFSFLNLSFDLGTTQNLNAAGVDTLYSVLFADTVFAGIRLDQAINDGLVPESAVTRAFEREQLVVKPFDQVLREVLTGSADVRAEKHEQRFVATFRPRLNAIDALNWINIQDVGFTANYNWQNGAVGRNTGAAVRNQVELRAGMGLRVQEFWRKFGFYKSMEEAQRKFDADRDRARQTRDRERAAEKAQKAERKKAEQAEREERRKREEAEKEERRRQEEADKAARDARIAAGLPPDPDPDPEPASADSTTAVADSAAAAVVPPAPAAAAPDAEAPSDAPADTTRRGFRLPLPNPVPMVRRLFLTVTGIRDFTVSYSGTRSSTSSNVGIPILGSDSSLVGVETPYNFLDALEGRGPSMRYRLGLERRFDASSRIIDPSLQVGDNLENANRFQARTTISPSQALQLNINWSADWTDGQTFTYRPALDDLGQFVGIDTTLTENGSNKASVWAFGASYLDLFQRQLRTLDEDVAVDPTAVEVGDANGDGRVILSNASVTEDFRSAYVKGAGTLDARNLLPMPKPNWTLSYSGMSKWPILRRLVQSLTLRHGYTAEYQADYQTNSAFSSEDPIRSVELGSRRILQSAELYQTGAMRINERYSPLIGVDISWKGQVTTNVSLNRSNAYSFSASNMEVSENRTSELSVTAGFQKTGMKLPFFGGKRLNNRASVNLTVSLSTTEDQRLRLRRALESAASDPAFLPADALAGDNISLVTAHKRLTVSPRIAYQFSNRVSADFTLRYEQFDSEDSRQPSSVQITGTFNVRVSISN